MRVRGLTSVSGVAGSVGKGTVVDLPDAAALEWARLGLVELLAEVPQTEQQPEPEQEAEAKQTPLTANKKKR